MFLLLLKLLFCGEKIKETKIGQELGKVLKDDESLKPISLYETPEAESMSEVPELPQMSEMKLKSRALLE